MGMHDDYDPNKLKGPQELRNQNFTGVFAAYRAQVFNAMKDLDGSSVAIELDYKEWPLTVCSAIVKELSEAGWTSVSLKYEQVDKDYLPNNCSMMLRLKSNF